VLYFVQNAAHRSKKGARKSKKGERKRMSSGKRLAQTHRHGRLVVNERKAKPASAKLCEVRGHSWEDTTSDKVKRCSVLECHTVKMLVRGHWKYFEYSRKASTRQLIEMQALHEQVGLWESE